MITSIQYDRAFALATAHGHHWALALAPSASAEEGSEWATLRSQAFAALAAGGVFIALIKAASDALGYGPSGGIAAPTLDRQGHVVHTTKAGSLAWDVAPEGTVRLEIRGAFPEGATAEHASSPPSLVLRAIVAPDLQVRMEHVPPCESRHVELIDDALRALGLDSASRAAALADARAACPDAQDRAHALRRWAQEVRGAAYRDPANAAALADAAEQAARLWEDAGPRSPGPNTSPR